MKLLPMIIFFKSIFQIIFFRYRQYITRYFVLFLAVPFLIIYPSIRPKNVLHFIKFILLFNSGSFFIVSFSPASMHSLNFTNSNHLISFTGGEIKKSASFNCICLKVEKAISLVLCEISNALL